MMTAVILAVVAVSCGIAAYRLPGRAWPRRAPRAAIMLWQALGLACGTALIGALLGVSVAPYGEGVLGGLVQLAGDASHGGLATAIGPSQAAALTLALALGAVLVSALVLATVGTMRTRRRQRTLLGIVGRPATDHPELTLVDHPAAAAYCLPGFRSQIVISAGALEMLSPRQLRAVIAHERAHASERHDLVLLPFASLRSLMWRCSPVQRICDEVELLVEMAADDRARRHTAAPALAAALRRVRRDRDPAVPGSGGHAGDVGCARVCRRRPSRRFGRGSHQPVARYRTTSAAGGRRDTRGGRVCRPDAASIDCRPCVDLDVLTMITPRMRDLWRQNVKIDAERGPDGGARVCGLVPGVATGIVSIGGRLPSNRS